MATKKATGMEVACPYCHDADAIVALNLNDLSELRCSGCDETFSAETARDMARAELARWERVVRFVEMGRNIVAE